ncbi:GH25 family lysozyme [Alicyclobacillus fastidiosus]
MTPGIDVSSYQGDITWSQVAQAGYIFAICRATIGATDKDSTFPANYMGARAAGLISGAYNFAYPVSSTAIDEANAYVAYVKDNGGFVIPPILDIEQAGVGNLDSATIRQWCATWGTQVKSLTGMRPILYSSTSFIEANQLYTLAYMFDLWIADYGVASPNLGGWPTSYKFWQYSDTADVPGINAQVDLNYFNGTLDQLKQYCGMGVNNVSVTVLAVGSTGDAVRTLQTDLNKVLGTKLTVDGDFGPATEAAVRTFQQLNHLTVDGEAGPQTLAAIQKALNQSPTPAPTNAQIVSQATSLLQQAQNLLKGVK